MKKSNLLLAHEEVMNIVKRRKKVWNFSNYKREQWFKSLKDLESLKSSKRSNRKAYYFCIILFLSAKFYNEKKEVSKKTELMEVSIRKKQSCRSASSLSSRLKNERKIPLNLGSPQDNEVPFTMLLVSTEGQKAIAITGTKTHHCIMNASVSWLSLD